MAKKVVVIGSGFAGLSTASFLAKAGYGVEIVEKNETPGGRARQFRSGGFEFDMGPSWYWMPDVFDRYFEQFGKTVKDYYQLKRLDPSYRVYFGENDYEDLPADMHELEALFEKHEKGAGKKLQEFLADAKYKYEVGIQDLVFKPGQSLLEFADKRVISGVFKLDLLNPMSKLARKYFKHKRLLEIVEFPVLFLGAKPSKTPALYSLMNYADMALGTWYPERGMHSIIKGMVSLAEELGVKITTDAEVKSINTEDKTAKSITTKAGKKINLDILVSGADYQHTDKMLLSDKDSNYSNKYWDTRTMAPSCLLFYLGLDRKVDGLIHHNLFFDKDFNQHAVEIYDEPQWPSDPLFYVSVTSKTDPNTAPANGENLFLLVPLAPNLEDSDAMREKYYNMVMDRLEQLTGQTLRDHIIYKRGYAMNDFKEDYHAFKGNAYGLANTLKQTALLKPSLKNKNLTNMYYTGQLTTPGPGVPPSLISGEVVANEIIKNQSL